MIASGVSSTGLYVGQPYVAGLTGGYGDEYDVGLDRIKLGGVENVIKFNGYKINDRKVQDAIIVTSIDGLSDADVRDSREVNPGYDGETAFSSHYGGRTIVLSGYIRSGTLLKLRDMQEGLKTIFAPLEECPLTMVGKTPDKSLTIQCRKSQPITMGEVQQGFDFKREFQITLRASDFRFTSSRIYNEFWQNSADPTNSLQTPSAFTGQLFINDIYNLGNFSADTIIKIKGPVIAPTNTGIGLKIENRYDENYGGGNALSANQLTDLTGLQQTTTPYNIDQNSTFILKGNGTGTILTANEYFLVDSKKRTITKYDENDVAANASYYGNLDIDSQWLNIAPGPNPIWITAYGGSAVSNPKITIYYRYTFI